MVQAVAARPLAALSPEIHAFAVERGVEDYVPAVFDLVRRLFPELPLRVLLVNDPEIEAYRHIAFEVPSGEDDAERLLALRRQWTRGLFEICPPSHVLTFLLRLR